MLKKLVTSQMTQRVVVDVCSPAKDRWVTQACTRPMQDAVALAEAYSPGRFQRRAGAFGLSAGVAMDLRLGGIWSLRLTRSISQERLTVEKPHLLIFSSHVLGLLPVAGKARQNGRGCRSRAGITWSLVAVWHYRRSNKVDVFSSNILGRRRRGTSHA